MAPPSSSGTTVGEALNILSGWNLSAEPRATALFHYLEASRLAYADRNAWVGDPRYVGVPVHSLLDPRFAATRRCLVHHTALTSPVAPGDPFPPYQKCKNQGTPAPAGNEGMHTNNIVTADKWGDVVGYTNTINFFGGSGETVPGYGFLLNNEMTDFDFAPPAPGAYDPNLPAGGKQPRSSMGPAIALQRREAGLRRGGGRRRDDHHHDPADHPEPRGLRHVAARRAGGAPGQPDELGRRRWPSPRSTTVPSPSS